jgi:hypothetical protein
MASRIGSITAFAPLSPPWQLTQLDQNFTNGVTAFNDSSLGYANAILTDTGSANNYIVACPFGAPTVYNQGTEIYFIPANSNTGASTLTVSPLGSAPIQTITGAAVTAGFLTANQLIHLIYIGSAFRIVNQAVYNPNNFSPAILSPGTTAIPMAGFTHLYANVSQSTSGTYTYNMTNLALGTFIYFLIRTSGNNKLVILSATDPSSVAYNINAVYQNSHIHFPASQDAATTILLYQGVTTFDTNAAQNVLYLQASFY